MVSMLFCFFLNTKWYWRVSLLREVNTIWSLGVSVLNLPNTNWFLLVLLLILSNTIWYRDVSVPDFTNTIWYRLVLIKLTWIRVNHTWIFQRKQGVLNGVCNHKSVSGLYKLIAKTRKRNTFLSSYFSSSWRTNRFCMWTWRFLWLKIPIPVTIQK